MERAPETARKSLSNSVIQPGSSSDDSEIGVHLCEVCGGCFETKRGLSSHCRSHLRQLGVAVSDSSGAPIDLLYQLIRERDGKLPFPSSHDGKTPIPKKSKTPQTATLKTLKTPQTPTPKISNPLQTSTPQTANTSQTSTPKAPKTMKTPKTLGTTNHSATKLKIKISTLVKKKYNKSPAASLASLTPGSSASPLSLLKLAKPQKVPAELKKLPASSSPSSSLSLASSKPLWAPQETDAPLDLMAMSDHSMRDDVHVCELCGAWYETRKGLSCHARAHLRQFGVEIDSKGSPIDILHELLQKEDQQELKNSPLHLNDLEVYSPSSTSSGPAPKQPPLSSPSPGRLQSTSLSPPPSKKLKASPAGTMIGVLEMKTRKKGEKHVSCEFCHEHFKKSQSLASHARSHLRQFGITNWSVHGSPMAALRDLMASHGTTSLPKPHAQTLDVATPTKTNVPSLTPPRKLQAPLTTHLASPTKSHASPTKPYAPPTLTQTIPPTTSLVSTKLPAPTTKPMSSAALPPNPTASLPSFATPLLLSPSSISTASLPGPTPPRVPKAKKGSRTVVPKPKDEPVELAVTVIEPPKTKNTTTSLLTAPGSSSNQSNTVLKPMVKVEVVPVRCEYCNDTFDTRKALSCHARAHLRQLGVKWSPNASPIDTLHELMVREGIGPGSEVKPEPPMGTVGFWKKANPSLQMVMPSSVDFLREKSDSLDSVATGCEATCELCGFDFENRKALASHARAHLRQQGVDWHTNGSPIETLAEWMQREPGKVAELHRRYMQGDLPQVVKRRSSSSPHPSLSDLDPARPASTREIKGRPSTSAHRKPSAPQRTPAHTASRGCERRPPKHLPHGDGRLGAGPLKPRVGNAPSLMPRPPESSLVKLVGKVYSLKCRFCEEVFKGPLSVQEDWLIHLRQHILNLKKDSTPNPASTSQSPPPTHTDTVQLTV